MITNQIEGEKVYIDIDIVYADFLRSMMWQSIRERLPGAEEYLGNEIARLRLRPSSSGNAHIEITFLHPLNVLENLCIRSWLNDDVWRLRLDLVRYLKTGDTKMVNRLWDGKYMVVDFVGEMRLCGDWMIVPLDYLPAARIAWREKQERESATTAQPPPGDPAPIAASTGGENEVIPAQPITREDEAHPEMCEELTPMPFETWTTPKPS